MSWYDYFIPPEIQAGRRAYAGDWEGAAKAELGLGGNVLGWAGDIQAPDMGFDAKKEGYTDAAMKARDLGKDMRRFYMQGLEQAQGFYQPAEEMNRAIYGDPSKLRK